MAEFDTGVAVPGGASFVPPRVDFSPIGDLSKDYYAGQAAQDQLASRRAFRNGIPVDPQTGITDYFKMADTLAKTGGNLDDIVKLSTAGAGLSLANGNADAIGGGAPQRQPAAGGYTGAVDSSEGDTKNPRSSADRRFNFLDGTWDAVRQSHPELNLPPTKYDASDDQLKSAFDAFTKDNTQTLQQHGIPTTARNQYLAHFLGANGATAFYKSMRAYPNAPAYSLVSPDAARSNPEVFFNKDGTPKTAIQVYGQLTSRYANVAPYGAEGQPVPTQVAGPAMVQTAPGGEASGQAGAPAVTPDNPFPSASALVPPAWRNNPSGYANMLARRAAAMATINPKGAEPLSAQAKAVQDAIVKDTAPPDLVRQWQLTRDPNESFVDWQARAAGAKKGAEESATPTPTQKDYEYARRTGDVQPDETFSQWQARKAGQVKGAEDAATTTPAQKEYQADHRPGENFTQWSARKAGAEEAAKPTGPMKEAVAQAGGIDVTSYQAGRAGATKDAEADATSANKMLDDATSMGMSAANGQSKVQWLKSIVNQPGFYSGPLSNQVKTFQQWRATFGNPASAVPQEAFDKVVNDMLTEQIKAMGKSGVGRVLLAEVQNMRNSIASSGITPMSNRALLELTNRVYQQQRDLAGVLNNTPHTRAAMQAAEEQYYNAHPLISEQEKQNPMLLGAPDAPAQAKTPQDARAWAQSVGLKPGDPIRFNGKYVAVP